MVSAKGTVALMICQESLFPVFLCQFHDLIIFAHDITEILSFMGKEAVCTVLDSFFCVLKISSAPIPQSIQRAIAEQAVKILRIVGFMTGKILTFFVAEKGIFLSFPIWFFFYFTHGLTPFLYCQSRQKILRLI